MGTRTRNAATRTWNTMGTRTRNADSGAGTTQPASSNPDGHRHTAGGMPILGSPTQIDQSDSRLKAATSLLTLFPVSAASLILGYCTRDTSIPKEWVADLASFIASWSDSSVSQCNLALRELNHFLNRAAGTPFDVPPVHLRAFLVEAALRGTSVPRSRLDGLCFAVNHVHITGIPVKAEIVTIYVSFKQRAAPEPAGATWPTIQMVLHLECIAASEHLFPVVRYYAATLFLCCFQSLRVIDAQSSSILGIANEVITGRAWDSKKPSSRASKPFTWSASTQGLLGTAWARPIEEAWGTQSPTDLRSIGLTSYSRHSIHIRCLGSRASRVQPEKPEHQEHGMRALLAFNPLRMPRSQSQKFTGHSLRHFMTELGGAMLMDPANPVTSRANGAAAGQAVPAIRYRPAQIRLRPRPTRHYVGRRTHSGTMGLA
ncbi:hypothetical protein T492DRAFT_960357 [Pavlovales sp. CCMP2436]|nr:hypothetical protein T492DRAFT_960357 [Pavlovales sp. CCMP2436]